MKFKKFAVIGSPISHSLSPIIHKMFAKQFGINLQYEAIKIETNQLKKKLATLNLQKFTGINITSPLKEAIIPFITDLSLAATKAQAINTITFKHNSNITDGDNTDGIGLIRDLMINNNLELKNKRILILGAGGACRGILANILEQSPKRVMILNRTYEKALTISNNFSAWGNVTASSYESLPQSFDLLINTTTLDFGSKEFNTLIFPSLANTVCYDINYNTSFTKFKEWAHRNNAVSIINGLGMLVEQAAASFYIWHNITPNTALVISQIKQIRHMTDLSFSLGQTNFAIH